MVKKAHLCPARGLLLLLIAVVPAAAQDKPATRTLGVVDDVALARARSDFPALARRVLPQIAVQKKLSSIVFKSGIGWSASGIKWVDVTPDVMNKVRSLPAIPQPIALSAAQKDAAEKAVLALTQLKSATSIGVTFDEFSSRLINSQAIIETSLTGLPSGSLHDAISQTLQTYITSLGTWRDLQALKAIDDEKVQMQRDIEDNRSMTNGEYFKLKIDRQNEDKEREKKTFKPLYAKWNEAEKQLASVVSLLTVRK